MNEDTVHEGTVHEAGPDTGETVDTSKAAIAEWCRGYIADLLEVPAESIDLVTGFDRLGVDSAIAVSLLIEVEERYGVELPAEAMFDNPNLDAVAEYLSPRAHPAAG
ncbi:MAG TPA: acyl carrier protein [Trebonia sp.]